MITVAVSSLYIPDSYVRVWVDTLDVLPLEDDTAVYVDKQGVSHVFFEGGVYIVMGDKK